MLSVCNNIDSLKHGIRSEYLKVAILSTSFRTRGSNFPSATSPPQCSLLSLYSVRISPYSGARTHTQLAVSVSFPYLPSSGSRGARVRLKTAHDAGLASALRDLSLGARVGEQRVLDRGRMCRIEEYATGADFCCRRKEDTGDRGGADGVRRS
jgi:hypothetical protein